MSDCIFCKIATKKITSTPVFEDDEIYAFRDINPVCPDHILFIPKKHIVSMDQLQEEDAGLAGRLLVKIAKFAREQGYDKKGYRLVANTGSDGGQTVFHLHFHLLAGRAMHWPPG